jgi:DNA-binding MarR family transcriptional regulator
MQMSEIRIRQMIVARRLREKVIGEDLFSDPAWDILLEAFAAFLGRRSTSLAELSSAAGVTSTAALRWIRKLQTDGLLQEQGGAIQPRGTTIELSPKGVLRLQEYFASVATRGTQGL